MARPTQQNGSVRATSIPLGAVVLVACLLAAPASAQEAAKPAAASPAPAATAVPKASPSAPGQRKRSAFGEAMSQLTQALSDASRKAASPPPAAADAPAPVEAAATAVDHGTLAVESPP